MPTMIGAQLNGHCRLEAELGEGGIGRVCRARNTPLDRCVAVKVLPASELGAEGRTRLLREPQIDHPNVVSAYDAGDAEVSGSLMNGPKQFATRVLVILVLISGFAGLWPLPVLRASDQVVTSPADSGPGSLRQAINDVHVGGTITFDLPSYVSGIVLTSGELVISRGMTIAGPGADTLFVSGDDGSRVFNITSGTVTISGLTISDGRVTEMGLAKGGGILNFGNLTLREVTLESNVAAGAGSGGSAFGGGVYSGGPLVVEESLLVSNLALSAGEDAGGSQHVGNALGGAIYVETHQDLAIRGSHLLNNTARGQNSWVVCTFDYGDAWGGAIYAEADGHVSVQNSALSGNKALGSDARFGGVSPDPRMFVGGDAYGGAIYLRGGLLTLEASTITGNIAEAGNGTVAGKAFGGGVAVAGGTTVLSAGATTFSDNRAYGGEGEVYGPGVAHGGAIHINAGTADLMGCELASNLAQGGNDKQIGAEAEGGALSAGGGTITTVRGGAVTGNRAQGGAGVGTEPGVSGGGAARGGGIHSAGTLTLIGVTVSGNVAQGAEGVASGGWAYGGGIHVVQPGTCTIQDSWLDGNSALGGAGGAGYNSASAQGGGAFLQTTATLQGTVLSTNTAQGGDSSDDDAGDGAGGGLWVEGSVTVSDIWLWSNKAQGGMGAYDGGDGAGGGAATGYDTTLTMSGSLLAYNLAAGSTGIGGVDGKAFGGGLHTYEKTWDNSSVEVINSTFSDNEAWSLLLGQGGGLWVGPATSVELSFCTIVNNRGGDEGGGIYSATAADNEGPALKNTILGANTAGQGPQFRQRIQSRGYNLIQSLDGGTLDTLPLPNTGDGNIVAPPKVGPLQYNGGPTWTHAPLAGADPSQAIDHGNPTDIDGLPITVDQRGFPRPFPADGNHDIGAHEYGSCIAVYLPLVARE